MIGEPWRWFVYGVGFRKVDGKLTRLPLRVNEWPSVFVSEVFTLRAGALSQIKNLLSVNS